MNTAEPRYCLNGEEPKLAGKRCTALLLEHFYEDLKITDQVNVAHLCFGEHWYRLYFECATVFWRRSERPLPAENSSPSYGRLLNDLSGMESVVGQTVERVAYSGTDPGDVHVTIAFANGKSLEFAYCSETDSTRLVGFPPLSGQPTAGFAAGSLPLMSNVRPHDNHQLSQ